MAVKTTGATALKFKQPSHIIATVFTGEETEGMKASGDTFILETVVRDTTSVTQDDPETTDIECETSDSPIDSVTKLGKYQFSTEVADTQKDLVTALMGWTEKNKKVLAPAGYVEKFVEVAVVFANGDTNVAFVIPRLKLNSKLMLESMNSNIARVNLAGTAYDWKVDGDTTPFYMDTEYEIPSA